MATRRLNLTTELYQYIADNSLRESECLQELREYTSQLPGARMQISPEQGQFMALLAELIQARKVIEIGTYTGYSSLVVAEVLPEDGILITCDIDEKATSIAKKFWQQAGVDNKIQLRLGPGLDTLKLLLDDGLKNSFDFAFIDADKRAYESYYELILQLTRQGGLILIDNVLWSGRVADVADSPQTEALQQFNKKVLQDERVSLSLLPIGDGLTLARKR